MPSLFDSLIALAREEEVAQVIAQFTSVERCRWRPVGDSENNLATINLGSDPAAGVVERITNAIDAVLEREWEERGRPADITSPRAAVAGWFHIEAAGSAAAQDRDAPRFRELADRVRITLRDSGEGHRPTIDIRDRGTGLAADEFAATILSLQRNRKLRRLFLAGEFGQGGSTALSYSPYTTIISRPHGGAQPVAVTVVRFNRGDPKVDKHGVYEYLVSVADDGPFTYDVDEERFAPGTLVRHIAMDLGKYRSALTAETSSLWYLANHYLFDPVLPFVVEEARPNSDQGKTLIVAGNHRRLSRATETEYRRSAYHAFRDGRVSVNWWVLSAEGEEARNRITRYTLPSKPIVITYNGQKQGELPNTIIKNDLKLPYLERYLIVHLDCDLLDAESRRQLFPTTRESLRDTSLMEELRQLVTDILYGDEELRRLDRERKQRFIRHLDSRSVENIRRRLARRVKATVRAGGRGRSPRAAPPGEGDGRTPPEPIPVNEPPTLLEVVSPTPRRVYAGRRFSLRFRTDADPAYFVDPDAFIAIVDPRRFGRYTGTTNVRDGHGVAYFETSEEAEVGARAEVALEVRPRGSEALGVCVDALVIPLPEDAATDPGKVPTPNINPQWVSAGDAFWVERDWDESSVAAVVREADSVDVYVSADNRRLNSLLARAQRRNMETVDSLKEFYLEHTAFHALLAELDTERARAHLGGELGHVDAEQLELERELELARACETVCGIMEQIFEFFATAARSGE